MGRTLNYDRYVFHKPDHFFHDIEHWDTVGEVRACTWDSASKQLDLTVAHTDNSAGVIRIYFVAKDIIRVRYNPSRSGYPDTTTRNLVMDLFSDLRNTMPATNVLFEELNDRISCTTLDGDEPYLRLIIDKHSYRMTLSRIDGQSETIVLRDSERPIRFQKIVYDGGSDDAYWIVQERKKPSDAMYVGFGEKGGQSFSSDGSHLAYFNYDNMRYRQVYGPSGGGVTNPSEPLYDSTPYFTEFAISRYQYPVGTFIDSCAELLVDAGADDSTHLRFGTMFGDLDYYLIVGDQFKDVMRGFVSLTGRPKLKPRYVLGYHQACYGYESRTEVEHVVSEYRDHNFPLDCLHIDVDLQDRYQTFTVDTHAFPHPQEMFQGLRALGIKCSTNITPIISNRDQNYATYTTFRNANLFVTDERRLGHPPQIEHFQNYSEGNEWWSDQHNPRLGSAEPFEGEVFYGTDADGTERGTSGHYAELATKQARILWGEQYRYLMDLGLEFIWQDMTTPAIRDTRGDMKSFPFDLLLRDNHLRKYDYESDSPVTSVYSKTPAIWIRGLYAYNLHKATYHGLNHLDSRHGKRNFIIGRGGFAGMHRFAGIWTGDNESSWDCYRVSLVQVMRLGISGQPIAGADVGGFEALYRNGAKEEWADPELFIRWMLLGAFLPWFRNHYIKKTQKIFQEPYRFTSVLDRVPAKDHFMYRAVLPVTRHYVGLRYRLMQLFYDLMFESSLNGLPIARPLILSDSNDVTLIGENRRFLDSQFLVGNDLLIAPVLAKQSDSHGGWRDIYLPQGSRWYCFMDGQQPLAEAVDGGQIISYHAYIDPAPHHLPFILPIYVRAGAVIPHIEIEQYIGERNGAGGVNPISYNIYPGIRGSYNAYLDDGVSRSSTPVVPLSEGGDPQANGEYRHVYIEHRMSGNQRAISIIRKHDGYLPEEDFFFLCILHDPSEPRSDASGPITSILHNGAPLQHLQNSNRSSLWAHNQSAWIYDPDNRITHVKIFDDQVNIELIATYFT